MYYYRDKAGDATLSGNPARREAETAKDRPKASARPPAFVQRLRDYGGQVGLGGGRPSAVPAAIVGPSLAATQRHRAKNRHSRPRRIPQSLPRRAARGPALPPCALSGSRLARETGRPKAWPRFAPGEKRLLPRLTPPFRMGSFYRTRFGLSSRLDPKRHRTVIAAPGFSDLCNAAKKTGAKVESVRITATI